MQWQCKKELKERIVEYCELMGLTQNEFMKCACEAYLSKPEKPKTKTTNTLRFLD